MKYRMAVERDKIRIITSTSIKEILLRNRVEVLQEEIFLSGEYWTDIAFPVFDELMRIKNLLKEV